MLVNASQRKFATCVDLRWMAKRCKNLGRLAYECEFDQSTQIIASGRTNETQVEHKSKTCVDLRRLASPFGQSSTGEGRGGEGRGKGKSTEEIWNRKKGQKKRGQSRAVQNRISPSADILQLQPKQLLSAFRSVAHWQFLPCCTPVCDTRVPGPAAPLPSLGLKIEEKICVYVYVYVYV